MLNKYPGRCFLLGMICAFFLWEGTIPYLCCTQISYPSISEDTTYISLPFFNSSSPKTARFNAYASLYYLPFQTGILEVTADDCVERIAINNKYIEDSVIKNQPHCYGDYVTIDIANYLHPGQNDLEIQLSDKGGAYGLNVGISHGMPIIILMLGSLGISFYSLRRLLTQIIIPAWITQFLIPLDKSGQTLPQPAYAPQSSLLAKTHLPSWLKHPCLLRHGPNAAITSIIIFMSLIYVWPIISTHEWFYSHAQDSSVYMMEMFRDSFSHGNWYPRWLPDMQGGYGYPTFLFTQPGFFYFSLPFVYLISSPVFGFYISLFLITCIGGAGAYKLSRLYCDRLASVVCMVLFYTTHYLAINLFARGDLTEFSAMMLSPWAVYYFIRVADGIKNHCLTAYSVIGLIGVSVCIIMIHPFVAFYCLLPAILMIMGKWAESGYNSRLLIILSLCILIIVTLTCPYWLTVLQLKEFVSQGGKFVTSTATTTSQLFGNDYFNIGKLHFTLAVLGWMCSARNVFFRYVCLAYFLLLFLLTHYSDFIWHLDTPLKYSQFPWRINSVVAVVQLLGIIQLVKWCSLHMQRLRYRSMQTGILVISAMSIVYIYMFQITFGPPAMLQISLKEPYRIWGPVNYEQHKKELEQKEFIYAGVYREFFPLTADYDNLPNRIATVVPMVQSISGTNTISMAEDASSYQIHFTANTLTKSSLLINQMFFPGWEVRINNHAALNADKANVSNNKTSWGIGDHGRIRVDLPDDAGSYDVQAWYDGPPDWEARNIVMILLASILSYALYRQCRKT